MNIKVLSLDEFKNIQEASTTVFTFPGGERHLYVDEQETLFGQLTTRDTFSSAVKATRAQIDGKPYNLLKDPVTGTSKKSATGRLAVVREALKKESAR